jgi:hypothetical protein
VRGAQATVLQFYCRVHRLVIVFLGGQASARLSAGIPSPDCILRPCDWGCCRGRLLWVEVVWERTSSVQHLAGAQVCGSSL